MEEYKEKKLKGNPRNLCANCGKLAVRKVENKYQPTGWCDIDCQNEWLKKFNPQ